MGTQEGDVMCQEQPAFRGSEAFARDVNRKTAEWDKYTAVNFTWRQHPRSVGVEEICGIVD
jgi:hypothetical protein